ncbi:MAG: FAD-dependent oxidoreductase [Patescibacteria group bacterium]
MRNILILGAGFGGLRAATQIAKNLRRLKLLDKYRVVLVDRNDCHLYTPLLYKLAASASVQKDACTYSIISLIHGLPIDFIQGKISKIDLVNGDVHIEGGRPIKCEFLVLALGSETNYFGIPGLKENSLELKTMESSLEIKAVLSAGFKKGGGVKIVVGGAGAGGIELASEIRLWADHAVKNKNLRVDVSLLEAMPTILPGLDKNVISATERRLKMLGVAINVNAKIVSVKPREITLDGGTKIPFDIFVWTGGIKTPELLAALPLQKEPRGKPLAESGMACLPAKQDLKLYPMIYGLGDSVCFMDPKTKRPVPAVARAALAQADVVAKNLIEDVKASEGQITNSKWRNYKSAHQQYKPWDYPYVIPAGGRWAVAKIGPFVISGFSGWVLKELIELNYLFSIMSFFRALRTWFKGVWIFVINDRF